jgi:hypothetical protein
MLRQNTIFDEEISNIALTDLEREMPSASKILLRTTNIYILNIHYNILQILKFCTSNFY